MLAFLKNTVTQINVETRQGNAPVVCAQPASTSADPEPKKKPARVDAVTGGTQGISHYFAAQVQVQPPKPDTDDT
jgi:uncharacterized protein (DUF39 family)